MQRRAETTAFVELMPSAPSGNRDHLEVLILVHVPHRHQRAVFQLQAIDLMRAREHAVFGGGVRNQFTEFGIARVAVLSCRG